MIENLMKQQVQQQLLTILEMNRIKEQQEVDKLRQLNRYEDILDVFIHIMVLRLPMAFVLINMTLMIWLVQSIFSQNSNDSIPRSLYFFAPLLEGAAIIDIQIRDGAGCDNGYQQVIFKTFPNIINQSIKHNNLTRWKQSQIFCVSKSQQIANFTPHCPDGLKYCSGLCVNSNKQCPITNVRKIHSMEIVAPFQQIFYNTSDLLYRYVLSRESKNTYVVGIRAQYQFRCANQYHYYDQFPHFQYYWNVAKQCGEQGFLSSELYHPFDQMRTNLFLQANNIWSQKINSTTHESITQLGTITRVNFKKISECQSAPAKARTLQDQLLNGPPKPEYSKSLLIIAFVLFTISWIWLITYYCLEGRIFQKNIFVILLSVIELIAVTFIYTQNSQLIDLENKVNFVASCIDEHMSAFSHWEFGISNKAPFIGIMFACTSFLSLMLISYFIDCVLYVPYMAPQRQILYGNQSFVSIEQQEQY